MSAQGNKYSPKQIRKLVGFILLSFIFFMAALWVIFAWVLKGSSPF